MNLKKTISSGFKFLTDSDFRFLCLARRGKYDNMPDDEYLKRMFKAKMGKKLNLENPKTFNDKLQWLKLNDRKPIYTTMVDKIDVKKYVADIIGEEYIIPTLGVWDNPEDIDFDKLPNQFVLKCNHNSGCGMCICRDKSKFDVEKAKAELAKGLNEDYYLTAREWPYKNVNRRILAEKFMKDDKTPDNLMDYKFYCFNGVPKFAYLSKSFENHETARINYVTMDWKKAPFYRSDYAEFEEIPARPKNLNKMIELASVLSKDIPFLRVDFYEINEKVYFGELTFYPRAGFTVFEPEEWEEKFGDMLNIDNI